MSFLTGWFKPKVNGQKPRVNFYTRKFQLRDALWLTFIGVFCFALMGFLLYLALNRATDLSSDPVIAKELMSKTFSPRRILSYFEVSVPLFVFSAFLMSIGIVASHRIAGPIFAIKRHMNRVRMGELRTQLNLRRNDELQDVAAALNRMLDKFWSQQDATNDLISRAEALLQQGEVVACLEVLKQITEINKQGLVKNLVPISNAIVTQDGDSKRNAA